MNQILLIAIITATILTTIIKRQIKIPIATKAKENIPNHIIIIIIIIIIITRQRIIIAIIIIISPLKNIQIINKIKILKLKQVIHC